MSLGCLKLKFSIASSRILVESQYFVLKAGRGRRASINDGLQASTSVVMSSQNR